MSTPRRPGPSDFPRGFGILLNGFGMVLREGRRFWLGALPPLVTSVVFFGLFLLLASNATAIIAASPLAFAGVLGAIGLVIISGLLMVLVFTATTLLVGSPIYDLISEDVDAALGHAATSSQTTAEGIRDAAGRMVTTVALSIPVWIVLALVGLIPAVGGIAATVGTITFGGWIVALDLMGSAADRRGHTAPRQRHALARRRPLLALGFGIPSFLGLSVPLLSVAMFPGATAGGTILAARLEAAPVRRGRREA